MRLAALTAFSMLAFAGNSLLCRLALKGTAIDAATFTSVRIAAGALVLWGLVRARPARAAGSGSWISAAWLAAYAIAFSCAYISLSAGTGALLLFGAVQVTMIGRGLLAGERMSAAQAAGLAIAFAGLGGLVLPGLTAPPLAGALLMIAAGVSWGIYSLRGRGAGDPVRVTAGNFLLAAPFAMAMSAATASHATLDAKGIAYAIASGAVTSGLGYVLWYSVLPRLKATIAATVQLSVPVIAAAGGVAFLAEPVTLRLTLSSAAILGGVAAVILARR